MAVPTTMPAESMVITVDRRCGGATSPPRVITVTITGPTAKPATNNAASIQGVESATCSPKLSTLSAAPQAIQRLIWLKPCGQAATEIAAMALETPMAP